MVPNRGKRHMIVARVVGKVINYWWTNSNVITNSTGSELSLEKGQVVTSNWGRLMEGGCYFAYSNNESG